jgi:3-isopropylmalate/(R)-2-methylmalate dehydratase small subunit
MSLEKFKVLNSTAVPLAIENIDTDQIIPARFLKAVERKGFGENLFRDWKYDKQNQEIQGFPLNDKRYSGKILVSGKNFGCGSSREHAAWAIYDAGFRVVISSYFADIFKNNAMNNGILPIQISESDLHQIFGVIEENPQSLFRVDLDNQQFRIVDTDLIFDFEIEAYKKECLLMGYDDFDYLQSILPEIEEFEKREKA